MREHTNARLLIVSDSEPMAVLLREVLRRHPRIDIVGETWTAAEAVRITAELTPDLVVVASGVALREDAAGLADQVYCANPHAVVIVTAPDLPPQTRAALLDVCAIPVATGFAELASALEELIPDLRAPVDEPAGQHVAAASP